MSSRLAILPIGVLFVLSIVNCRPAKPTAEELNNPATALHLKIVSLPAGADVYGLDGDSVGKLLGVTPMTCKYVYRKLADKPVVFGTEVEQTITRTLTTQNFLNAPYVFQCWVIMDGYKPLLVQQPLEHSRGTNPWNFNSADAFKPGVKTISVELTPLDN